jgi:acyl carrier protein
MRSATLNELTLLFSDVFLDESISLHRSSTSVDIVGWDSFANISVMVAIEQQYGLTFSTREIGALNNVGELIDLINSKIASPRANDGSQSC